MSSRILVIGEISRPLVRRTRRDDGRVFGVLTIRDSDRLETRIWAAFVNDLELIEDIERLRVGEPIGVSGPFSFRIAGEGDEQHIEHRLTVQALVDTRPRKAKTKTAIGKEQRIKSDEGDLAPVAPDREEAFHDDPLPF